MNISSIRPGLLVSLKTTVSGNVSYRKRDIETDHLESDGSRQAVWETHRTVEMPDELDAATKTRSKCRSLIVAVCAPSAFGLLCPDNRVDAFNAAVAEARQLANVFNATASVTRVSVNVIAGRVASNDLDAVRAINSEVRELLEAMDAGLQRLDVKAVRDAADRARGIASMLSPSASAKAQAAIDAARAAARQIVKAGEATAVEIDQATLATIRESRLAFLDLDETAEAAQPEAAGRAIDLDAPADEMATIAASRAVPVPPFELEG